MFLQTRSLTPMSHSVDGCRDVQDGVSDVNTLSAEAQGCTCRSYM